MFSRRQEKNTYVWASGIEVGLRFLLEGFPGQKQSWGAKLNVFFVLLVLKWAPKWVFSCFSVQAEAYSLYHNLTFNITMTQHCRPPPAVMRSQSKHVDTGETWFSLSDGSWEMRQDTSCLNASVNVGPVWLQGLYDSSLPALWRPLYGTSVGVLHGHRGATCLTSHYTDPLISPVTADWLREPLKKREGGGDRISHQENGRRCCRVRIVFKILRRILKLIPAPGLRNKPISAIDD